MHKIANVYPLKPVGANCVRPYLTNCVRPYPLEWEKILSLLAQKNGVRSQHSIQSTQLVQLIYRASTICID